MRNTLRIIEETLNNIMLWLLSFLDKDKRANFLKLAQICFEGIAIIIFIILVLVSFHEFYSAIKFLFTNTDTSTNAFIKKILSSFEILFIAPIPLLVVFSFKRFMIKMFPLQIQIDNEERANLMDEVIAKKTFISSIIGVLSTFLLGLFIEQIDIKGELSEANSINILHHPYMFCALIILLLFFLLILVNYYYLLSSGHSKSTE